MIDNYKSEFNILVADPEFNLVHFSGMEEGRLIGGVMQSHIETQRVSHCAQKCLDLAQHSCLSFNYDFGVSGLCELLKAIEGHDHQIAKVCIIDKLFMKMSYYACSCNPKRTVDTNIDNALL